MQFAPALPLALLGLLGWSQTEGAQAWKLAPPKPLPDARPAELERWKELSCAECHEDVTREWARTTHAMAWIDPLYQESLKEKKKPESCHNCHIPEPLSHVEPGAKPKSRDPQHNWSHFGIDCNTCHLGKEGEILGPFGAPNEAHRSVAAEAFRPENQSAMLCIGCHATNIGPVIGIARDFVETEQEKKGRSCVGCHMAPLERTIAKDATTVRKGRSHELQTPRDPAFLARAFEYRARRNGDKVLVEFENVSGHRVPGLIGRVLDIDAELLDAQGASLAKGRLSIDHKQFAPVDGVLTLELEAANAAAGAKVLLKGLHDAPGYETPQLFLERTLELQ
ncbi:MAG: hypothetical protein RL277_194 [Planctomycetota bacterium]|jgi:hypothetical protein